MRTLRCSVLALVVALASSALAGALATTPQTKPLRVVTTIPDLADIAREIGGGQVEVSSICRGRENLHSVVTKPSHLIAMSQADLFVQIGLSLEPFVPGLLEGCRNPRIGVGKPGFVNCSEGWQPLDVPASLSRQGGDVHPHGNPHMNLDPRAGRHCAARVLAALIAVDAAHKSDYEKRHAAYVGKLDVAQKRWAELGAAWKGAKLVEYHQEFRYLANAYGIELAGTLENKPGIPPTPNHLAELIAAMKHSGVKVIVTAPWSNNDTVARVAEKTGATIVELPNMCGGTPATETWIGMMDALHDKLARAFGTPATQK